jgi:hypothetical protein
MRRPALLFALLIAVALPAGASARVPQGFVGMMIDGPLFPVTEPGIDISRQMDKMVSSGVESVRVVFDWQATQPYEHWADVPPADAAQFTDVGGVPTKFGQLDELVGLAAQHGLRVLPVVIYTPAWDAAPHPPTAFATPRRTGPYAAFVAALVQRYGPHGTFWSRGAPRVPLRMWQIWNEPNISTFWPPRPFAPSYVALLRAAHTAIKRADPGAKVVLAGLPNFSWVQLGVIYRVHGARRQFDVAAVHPYTAKPQGVITILNRVRNVMDRAGDTHKPILADEVSWPSSLGKVANGGGFDIATTEAGQARKIAALLPLLGLNRARLNLLGFDYYTWAGTERRDGLAFGFAGLFRFSAGSFVAKPAFFTFRRSALALEGCKIKGDVATACARLA